MKDAKNIFISFVLVIGCAILAFGIIAGLDRVTTPKKNPCPPGYTVIDSERVVLSNGDTAVYDHKKNWQPGYRIEPTIKEVNGQYPPDSLVSRSVIRPKSEHR